MKLVFFVSLFLAASVLHFWGVVLWAAFWIFLGCCWLHMTYANWKWRRSPEGKLFAKHGIYL